MYHFEDDIFYMRFGENKSKIYFPSSISIQIIAFELPLQNKTKFVSEVITSKTSNNEYTFNLQLRNREDIKRIINSN